LGNVHDTTFVDRSARKDQADAIICAADGNFNNVLVRYFSTRKLPQNSASIPEE
jgi:hypothetical protein